VAKRIAEELKTPLGEVVGYKVRFHDRLARDASVKLMTDGILLAETQGDPLLKAYDTLIIDEAHERSLNIDFLLGYLREVLPRRPDLKVVVTSATIDADRFAKHFASAKDDAQCGSAAAVRAAVAGRAGPYLRRPHRPAHRAGHQRGGDLAHRAGHPLRHRHRYGPRQTLQLPQQGGAAAGRAGQPGGGQPA